MAQELIARQGIGFAGSEHDGALFLKVMGSKVAVGKWRGAKRRQQSLPEVAKDRMAVHRGQRERFPDLRS